MENNTNVLNEYQDRVDKTKNIIDEFVALCLAQDTGSKTYLTLPNRLQVRLSELYRQERTMSSGEVLSLSADTLHNLYLAYLSIISYINTVVSYTPTKAEFLAFARINVDDFTNLLDNGEEDVKQECRDIDSDFINLTLSAAEKGAIKEKSGTIRLKAKGGIGHSLVEVGDTESVLDKISDTMEEKQLRYEFANIIDMKKQIDKK